VILNYGDSILSNPIDKNRQDGNLYTGYLPLGRMLMLEHFLHPNNDGKMPVTSKRNPHFVATSA